MAVGAYIGLNGNRFTSRNAEQETRLIVNNLEETWKNRSNLQARSAMA